MQILIYETTDGFSPFEYWLNSIQDQLIRDRVRIRILRLQDGNFGDHKFLSQGVWELRMNFGGGIRIYYGFFEDKVVLLLSGGNKNTQKRDIQKAILYMSEFLEVKNEKKI